MTHKHSYSYAVELMAIEEDRRECWICQCGSQKIVRINMNNPSPLSLEWPDLDDGDLLGLCEEEGMNKK